MAEYKLWNALEKAKHYKWVELSHSLNTEAFLKPFNKFRERLFVSPPPPANLPSGLTVWDLRPDNVFATEPGSTTYYQL